MDSRIFIKQANLLIKSIKDQSVLSFVGGDVADGAKKNLQKQMNGLFAELQNPTLPSAYKLMQTAHEYGYQVNPRIEQGIRQAEYFWQ